MNTSLLAFSDCFPTSSLYSSLADSLQSLTTLLFSSLRWYFKLMKTICFLSGVYRWRQDIHCLMSLSVVSLIRFIERLVRKQILSNHNRWARSDWRLAETAIVTRQQRREDLSRIYYRMIIIRVCDYEVTMAAGAVCVSLCHSLTVMRIQFSNVESLFQLWLKCVGGNFVASQLGTQNGGAPADLKRRFLGFSPASHDQLGPDPEVVEMVVGRMAVSRERERRTHNPAGC